MATGNGVPTDTERASLNMPGAPFRAHFSHIVINVSDLERSVAFYETLTPLRSIARTDIQSQRFATLGIARGTFSSALLRDPTSPLSPAVHLVQWTTPQRTGKPYPSFSNPGFFRICFQSDNIPRVYQRVIAAGAKPFSEPLLGLEENAPGFPVFGTPDPDGIVVQYIRMPGVERLFHVCCNCSEIAGAVAFYEALGLCCYMRMSTDEPQRFSFGPPNVDATFDAAIFDQPDDQKTDGGPHFCVDLVRWKVPAPTGSPYASQTNLGIVRLGLAVGDLGRAQKHLRAKGYVVSDEERRDFGAVVGTRRALIVKNPDGALVELFDKRM